MKAFSASLTRRVALALGVTTSLILSSVAHAATVSWDVNSNGSWNTGSNWSSNSVPNSVNASVYLGNVITSNRTITLNQDNTLGHLTINDNNRYTIKDETLNFDVSSGNASITVSNTATPQIRSDINFKDNLTITRNDVGKNFLISGDIYSTNSKDLTVTGTGNTEISGELTTSGTLTKTGSGTLELSGNDANSMGAVTVSGGTLELNKDTNVNALGSGTITVNSGGTLLLSSSNQISNSANMVLNGGTFSTGASSGYSETLGTLTLSSNSIIDLGTGSGRDLMFGNSSSATWAGLLTISGWVGSVGTSGTQGQIFFGCDSSGLTSTQLNQISFVGFGQGALLLNTGEVVPLMAVPEAEVVLGVLLLVGFVGWKERDRFRRWAGSAFVG